MGEVNESEPRMGVRPGGAKRAGLKQSLEGLLAGSGLSFRQGKQQGSVLLTDSLFLEQIGAALEVLSMLERDDQTAQRGAIRSQQTPEASLGSSGIV